jgi:hypothetical protein
MKTIEIVAGGLMVSDTIIQHGPNGQEFRFVVSDIDYTTSGNVKVGTDDGAGTQFFDADEKVVIVKDWG